MNNQILTYEDITTFEQLKEASGFKLVDLSNLFEIPYRTIQGWALGERKCPEYVIKLMAYRLHHEGFLK